MEILRKTEAIQRVFHRSSFRKLEYVYESSPIPVGQVRNSKNVEDRITAQIRTDCKIFLTVLVGFPLTCPIHIPYENTRDRYDRARDTLKAIKRLIGRLENAYNGHDSVDLSFLFLDHYPFVFGVPNSWVKEAFGHFCIQIGQVGLNASVRYISTETGFDLITTEERVRRKAEEYRMFWNHDIPPLSFTQGANTVIREIDPYDKNTAITENALLYYAARVSDSGIWSTNTPTVLHHHILVCPWRVADLDPKMPRIYLEMQHLPIC